MTETYDVIVVGTGGVGSAALFHLAQRGVRVLGLDRYPQAHANGSSHGQTRIIRQAYFEHPNYVPLLRRAYELWAELEAASQQPLFHQVGLVEAGPPEGVLIPGIMKSVNQHQLPIERMTATEANRRFPFRFPEHHDVVIEPTAGYLRVEDCVAANLRLAVETGAEWRQEAVLDWSTDGRHVRVQTDSGRYTANQLVVCGGAWSRELLSEFNLPVRILAKHQYWFQSELPDAADWPTYFFEMPFGYFYGFPQVTSRGPKVARHSGGQEWTAPQSLENVVDDDDETMVRRFLKEVLPGACDASFSRQACMYTVSTDEHFIVDRHPQHSNLCFVAGLSGHGFKFAPVLGEAVCELAMDGQTSLPMEFLGLGRFVG